MSLAAQKIMVGRDLESMKIINVILIILCLFVSESMAAPSGNSADKDRSNLPITIKSNELSADNKGKTAIFRGKVVAKQGDVTIYSDTLKVSYGDEKNDVEKIEADGNVRIVHGNRIGTSSHAVYESKLGKITMTGNPKVMEGADPISGKIITFFIDEEKSAVSGDGDSRVITVIHPQARKGNAGTR